MNEPFSDHERTAGRARTHWKAGVERATDAAPIDLWRHTADPVCLTASPSDFRRYHPDVDTDNVSPKYTLRAQILNY